MSAEPDKSKTAEKPSNGAVDWASLPVERAVARRIGIANAQLRRLAKTLGVKPYAAPDGTNRYSLDQVEQLRAGQAAVEDLASGDDDEEDAGAAVSTKKGEKHLLSAYAYALVQSQQHNERLIGIICGPVERILSTYNQHQDRIDKRVAELEKGRDEAVKARSEELQAAHERDQESKVIDAGLKRKEELFSMVAKKLPTALDAAQVALGFGNADELATSTLRFLKSLSMTQLGLLLSEEASVTTPEQRELIKKIMKGAGVELPDTLKDSPAAPAETETEKKG